MRAKAKIENPELYAKLGFWNLKLIRHHAKQELNQKLLNQAYLRTNDIFAVSVKNKEAKAREVNRYAGATFVVALGVFIFFLTRFIQSVTTKPTNSTVSTSQNTQDGILFGIGALGFLAALVAMISTIRGNSIDVSNSKKEGTLTVKNTYIKDWEEAISKLEAAINKCTEKPLLNKGGNNEEEIYSYLCEKKIKGKVRFEKIFAQLSETAQEAVKEDYASGYEWEENVRDLVEDLDVLHINELPLVERIEHLEIELRNLKETYRFAKDKQRAEFRELRGGGQEASNHGILSTLQSYTQRLRR